MKLFPLILLLSCSTLYANQQWVDDREEFATAVGINPEEVNAQVVEDWRGMKKPPFKSEISYREYDKIIRSSKEFIEHINLIPNETFEFKKLIKSCLQDDKVNWFEYHAIMFKESQYREILWDQKDRLKAKKAKAKIRHMLEE